MTSKNAKKKLCKGDKVVHPHHGGGVVVDIFEKEFQQKMVEYYLIHIIADSLHLYIPSHSLDKINIRRVEDHAVVEECLKMMQEKERFPLIKNPTPLESKVRDRIKEGTLTALAEAIGLICTFKHQREEDGKINVLNKNLSDLLNHAKKLFTSHLALVKDLEYREAQLHLQRLLDASFAV